MQEKLPNSTIILVLGILSIITCWCYGILGITMGIIGIVLAQKDIKLFYQNPGQYTGIGNVKTGKVMCIIGIVLSLITILSMLWIISIVGMDALGDEILMQERLEDYLERLD
ncbi:MAG: CCC motif membrane protein [Bacteroidota bacterium]|nr:CCC motif membrane protein [Bacteroidota bacterium]